MGCENSLVFLGLKAVFISLPATVEVTHQKLYQGYVLVSLWVVGLELGAFL